jgi:hypothetical protein
MSHVQPSIHFVQEWRRQITLCGVPDDTVRAHAEQMTTKAYRSSRRDCLSMLASSGNTAR